jgi:hypothetical protein
LADLGVSSLAQTDALAKLLIEKGLITREEFSKTGDVSKLLNPTDAKLALLSIAFFSLGI